MKVIFLDLDGVLNSEKYVHEMGKDWDGNQIDPKAVIRLNKIVDITDAKIVVSSSWRIEHSLENLKKIFIDNRIIGEVIGCTPVLGTDRSAEISVWLSNNPVDNFVILDDDRLEAARDCSDPLFDEHFVRTSWLDGLQDRHADKAIRILMT